MLMQPRRSNRETTVPVRLGFTPQIPSPSDIPLPSVEYPILKDESDSDLSSLNEFQDTQDDEMSPPNDFTDAQQKVIDDIVKQAVATALAASSAVQATQSPTRALTADLMPADDYFLPETNNGVPPVQNHQVKYPRQVFTDHDGEIDYDSWKMEMKMFVEEYSGNFQTGKQQVAAYFKCTGGEAKKIILQHMDKDFVGAFDGAADVLQALDQRFFDHNKVQAAKREYYKLDMGTMTYNQFRIKFTNFASTGKIPRSRWFEDVCEKISSNLKREIKIEKYKMKGDYATLDEFLAIADREARNITAEENHHTRRQGNVVSFEDRERKAGILKNNWRSSSPVPSSTNRDRSTSPFAPPTSFVPRPVSPTTAPLVAADTCRLCRKTGHWMKECPELARNKEMNKRIAKLSVGEECQDEDISKNS